MMPTPLSHGAGVCHSVVELYMSHCLIDWGESLFNSITPLVLFGMTSGSLCTVVSFLCHSVVEIDCDIIWYSVRE